MSKLRNSRPHHQETNRWLVARYLRFRPLFGAVFHQRQRHRDAQTVLACMATAATDAKGAPEGQRQETTTKNKETKIQKIKTAQFGGLFSFSFQLESAYRVDSISNPQASKSGSGIYFEFLLRRAHSRSRVERRYWSGDNLYSRTTCSNSVTVGVTGPIGSGLPQLGFPRRFAIIAPLAGIRSISA
jgi:hypothetical protein